MTTLPTTLSARKLFLTQRLSHKHPEWTWIERIGHVCKAHAMLEGGVSVGRILAQYSKPWEVKV